MSTRVRGGRLPLLAPAGLALTLVALPLLALLLRVEWAELPTHLSRPVVGQSLRLSAVTTSATMVVVWLLGTPLAWVLARSDHRLTTWVRALVTVPLVLPPVVGGVALLMTYGRRGVVGGWLEQVTEFTRLSYNPAGRIVHTDETGETPFDGHETVSMNTWGFFPGFFQSLEKSFAQFLEASGQSERSEFYIPSVVDPLIRSGAARVRVLHTPDPWFGVTYNEDKPWVMRAVRSLIAAGAYPERLWSGC